MMVTKELLIKWKNAELEVHFFEAMIYMQI